MAGSTRAVWKILGDVNDAAYGLPPTTSRWPSPTPADPAAVPRAALWRRPCARVRRRRRGGRRRWDRHGGHAARGAWAGLAAACIRSCLTRARSRHGRAGRRWRRPSRRAALRADGLRRAGAYGMWARSARAWPRSWGRRPCRHGGGARWVMRVVVPPSRGPSRSTSSGPSRCSPPPRGSRSPWDRARYEVAVVSPGGGGRRSATACGYGRAPPRAAGGIDTIWWPAGRARERRARRRGGRVAAPGGAAGAAGGVGVHGRVRCWRAPGCSRAGARRPTGLVRALARALSGGRRRARADLRPRRQRVDLGRRDGRDGPRAGAGRGGPRPRGRPGGGALARAVPRRPGGQSQFSAELAAQAARPRAAARAAGAGSPTTPTPTSRSPRWPRAAGHERAPVRPRVRAEVGVTPAALRRGVRVEARAPRCSRTARTASTPSPPPAASAPPRRCAARSPRALGVGARPSTASASPARPRPGPQRSPP